LGQAMGQSLNGKSARDVMEEIRSLVPLYAGMDYARLDAPQNQAGLQWPCLSKDDPGTSILYENGFPAGQGKFIPAEIEEELPEENFPWTLITGPTKFHSGSLSRMSPGLLRIQGEGSVAIHPADVRKLGLTNGQQVVLESRYGKITAWVSASSRTAPGVLFMPDHCNEAGAQQLAGRDLKIIQVKVEKS